MFEQTFVDTQNRATRPWTLAASATVQTGLAGLLLIIPLLHPEGPLMKIEGPPVVYRPVTLVQPPPAVNVTRAVRRTSLALTNLVVAPRRIPAHVVQFSDAPTISDTGMPYIPGSAGQDIFIGLPQEPVPQPVTARADKPVMVTPLPPAVPIRVSTSVQSALLIFGPKPAYPPLAKAARVQGTVRLQAIIGTDGNIRNLRVVSGPPLLAKAAFDTVQTWRYRPTVLNRTNVEVITEVEVNFTLSQ